MTEAVFDFAAINRRLNRKPEPSLLVNVPFERLPQCGCDPGTGKEPPACTCPECVDAVAAPEPAYSPVTHFNNEGVARLVNALCTYLDENEAAFIGWEDECPSKT